MDNTGITPVMPIGGGYGDGFGAGSGIWLFAILALMWGGNGFFGRGADGRAATVEDINNTTNFARLESQVQGGFSSLESRMTNLGNGICSLGYQLATDVGAIEKAISDCCCATARNIDSVRFDLANYTASINANTTAGIQKVLDKMCENEKAALQARVNQLELQQAFCGVPRFQPATIYGSIPFQFGNGCTCGNI